MKMDFQKIRERLGLSSDKPLTPEEKRRRARYIVYPLFCLLCAGFLLLVFSPSEKEKSEKEKGKGFNVEMPSPKDSEMEGNKVSAYEQEALAKKEKWRRGTFQEMSELLNKDSQDTAGLTAGKANTELPPEPETEKSPGSVHSSAEAYRNMNRSLGAVYTRNENQQNADLLRKYSINSLVYWVTYVHNVVYSFYRSMIYCYINSTQRCAGSIVIDIIPTNGADKRKFFPFAPYFPVTNVIKRYFYPYFPAIIGIKGYSFPYFPYLSGIMKIKTALYSLFSRLDWHKTVVFPCLGEIYEGIRSLSWEIPVT